EDDVSSVRTRDLARDRQPQARSLRLRPHVVAPEERLEDALAVRFGDARAGIGHLDVDDVLARAEADPNDAAFRGVPDGVVDEIADHALEADAPPDDDARSPVDLARH